MGGRERATIDETDKSATRRLAVTVLSFGYKEGPPPLANMVFDVRFLKNPYWVPELRPLSGLDQPVREYVLTQELAVQFLDSLTALLAGVLPRFVEVEIFDFSVAFGCTGGQHRSTALAAALSERLAAMFPEYGIVVRHRDLPGCADGADSSDSGDGGAP